ncbi:MAG: hypothetical protein QXZ70_08725 [Candidatus Bathyarchaeia archaeon]
MTSGKFIAVGVICVLLVVALVFSVVGYNLMLSEKDSLIASLREQVAALQNATARLSAELNELRGAKLISVNLKAEDSGATSGTPYVHVSGYVVNVGNSTAENAKIHVILQQSGGAVLKEAYVDLGSVAGWSFVSVDSKIYYDKGSNVVFVSMNLEWS